RLELELDAGLPAGWQALAGRLEGAGVEASLALLAEAYALPDFPPRCWQGELRPEAVAAARAARLDREKARLRVKLAELVKEARGHRSERPEAASDGRFEVATEDEDG